MDKMQEEMWDALCELSGEEVARLLTDWHGLQLLDEGFRKFLGDEGVMSEVEDEEDDDELGDDFDEFCSKYTACDGCQFRYVKGECQTLWYDAKAKEAV